jgi:NAD(P)-dependent dehydrogenase (short-subunit alcohol dehydrogenase family)
MQSDRRNVAVITGASSGIGKEAAKQLVSQGWHVIAHGRDASRSAAAETEIRAAAQEGGRVDMVRGDLCELAQVAGMARRIAELTDRVDLLINNAGGMRDQIQLTSEGNEVSFAGNHLGHFLLTTRLLPLLRTAAQTREAGAVRVISVSSRAHEHAPPIDWDDVQSTSNWTSHTAYGRVKLYNILFARELARQVADDGIISHSLHPGVVDTNFPAHGSQALRDYWVTAQKITAGDAASDLLWVAQSAEASQGTGEYFAERRSIVPTGEALDDEAARKLWQESASLVARAGV